MTDIAPKNKEWQTVTLLDNKAIAENVAALRFSVSPWTVATAGQHYDIRLTAPNGYQAERSYSLANPPEEEGVLEFGVQLLKDGEVSPYLWQLKPGDKVEVRGPIGGHFIWNYKMPGPLVLIGGGSGMVPLMAMLRHWVKHQKEDSERTIIFLISARALEYVLYKDELDAISRDYKNVKTVVTITDTIPPDWTGYKRRIDIEMVKEVLGNLVAHMPMIYVCGPTPFVEAVAKNLLLVGFNSHEVRTERFGGA
jgi:ferredoxin-NADP reductase